MNTRPNVRQDIARVQGRIFDTSTTVGTAMRRVKLVAYAVAFGTGLVLGVMLVRPAPQSPVGSGKTVGLSQYVSTPSPSRPLRTTLVSPSDALPHERRARRPALGRDILEGVGFSIGPPPNRMVNLTAPRTSSMRDATPRRTPPQQGTVREIRRPAARPRIGHSRPLALKRQTLQKIPNQAEIPRFHVQVGAFKVYEDARPLFRRLQSLGYAATLTEGIPHRVWAGGYFDRQTAERLANNLRDAGLDAVLVP
jgi:hypothetical protein